MEIQKTIPKTEKLLRENTGTSFGGLEINFIYIYSARIVEPGCLWVGAICRIEGKYCFKVRFIELFDYLKCVGILLLKMTKCTIMKVLEFITIAHVTISQYINMYRTNVHLH